ncbi:hypothetical protein [Halapricum hydrolyticum]|uniref:Uncharacterized protein n=1 Tax=Halapricum hydrolyticum TaxID=2979991 RepID=A0AAE3IC66_9EURY|nr:hypothetical protein [Halapricum hydrolyticum]MCU4717399.1 hypothetical protein [Halapricum hydrolyticum]MCU4726563.1 hypothetical protein [Halapricum hydrolyticum]
MTGARLWLDVASGLVGVLAGLVIVAAGLFGPLTVAGVDLGVTAMGLFGAGFSAVGIGHLRIDARTRGLGELIAGAGAIAFGLSFQVTPSIVPFVAGVLGLAFGGTILATESFGLSGA